MKRILSWGMFSILSMSAISLFSQVNIQNIPDTTYDRLKRNGQLNPDIHYVIENTNSQRPHESVASGIRKSSGCACYTPHDATWTLAMAPNDDGSTANIPIPFTFCLYGSNYTSLWINNNGNVTFDIPYGTYSAVGFPSASYVMVAPFWADVDTRGIGEVWYKITPTAVYVNWENVGYFNSHSDKTNTFSLIITDGNDPVIGVGNNVGFCYQDMQWTTGDASSGVNGFGGVPATVGCNKGDGISFVQFGRFDSPGTAYFGPYATNNGVSWLDNQSFIFNACNATNIAPVLAGGVSLCDTISTCDNQVYIDTLTFLSPEAGQITTLSASSLSPDFSVVSITNGNTASLIYQVNASSPGILTFTVTATDDGVPPQVVNYTFTMEITPNPTPNPILAGDTIICPGISPSLQVTNTIYDSYLWSNGSTTTSTVPTTGGFYSCTGTIGTCSATDSIYVQFVPGPTVTVDDTISCLGVPILFDASSPDSIVSYNWTWTGGLPANSTNSSETVSFPAAGVYPFSLTVENELGCTTTVNMNHTVLQSANADFQILPICISRFTFDIISGDSTWVVNWDMGDGTTFTGVDTSTFNYVYPVAGTYNVSMFVTNALGCTDTVVHPVVVLDTLTIKMPNMLKISSTANNNKVDMEIFKPGFNLCVEYTYRIYDRWGVKLYEAYNDPYNPDLFCGDCFQGKSETGAALTPGVYYYIFEGNYNIHDHGFITVFE